VRTVTVVGEQRLEQEVLPRGRTPGDGEQEPGTGGDEEERGEDSSNNQHMELATQLCGADASCELSSEEMVGRESKDGDEPVVRLGESTAARDEDAAVAEAAATVRLDEELAGRDEDRARRYVATVRPAMAALRYVRPTSAGDAPARQEEAQRRRTEEGDSPAASRDELETEECDGPDASGDMPNAGNGDDPEMCGGRPVTEEGGGTAVVASPSDGVANENSIAGVRAERKRKKREAKRLRAATAERRKHTKVVDPTGVDAVVTALDTERRTRREKQREDACGVLARRQQQHEGVRLPEGGQVAKVRLVQQRAATGVVTMGDSDECSVLAEDGLPTATMEVEGERLPVKLDSGARYSVAGTDWMLRGERVRRPAPVDVVEGIGGFVLNVVGVWAFEMRNVYGQAVTVEACIIDGCTDEFLVGVDFLQRHKAMMDFDRNEVRYHERQQQVIIPFRTDAGDGAARVAAVRLVSRVKLTRSAVTPMEVAVEAPDGEEGVFMPTAACGSVMMAATVTTSRAARS
jgi:hypothetical protein